MALHSPPGTEPGEVTMQSNDPSRKEQWRGEKSCSIEGASGNLLLVPHHFRAHKKKLFSHLILLFGAIACSIVLALGIQHGLDESDSAFALEASEIGQAIASAWKDYETLALWSHESCNLVRPDPTASLEDDIAAHQGFCSRSHFHRLYAHIKSLEVDFVALQFIPNITDDAREALEKESTQYHQKHNPAVAAEYVGIKELVLSDESVVTNMTRSTPKPFYLPVHYMLPLLHNEKAIEIDVYSFEKELIDKAFETGQAVMSRRAHLFSDPRPEVFAVTIVHPGISTSEDFSEKSTAVVKMVVKVLDLISRAAKLGFGGLSVYIFDVTEDIVASNGGPVFLAGADVPKGAGGILRTKNETSFEEVNAFPRLYTSIIEVLDHDWMVAVRPLGDAYGASTGYAILGGSVVLLSSVVLAIVLSVHLRRVAQYNNASAANEKDKATDALAQVQRERYLSDFVAHEIRNPLSSAIAALSFVHENARKLEDGPTSQAISDDLGVLEKSLNYINDLLRNMLDIHRTNSKTMKIKCTATNLLSDLLNPSRDLLFVRGDRGHKVAFLVDCPSDLVANVDRLRLEQIILNLALNSTKFVERGFIRLSADVLDGSVRILVEDSGPGIPLEKRGRLFEKYQESLDLLNQGTGVGLYISKNLSDLMGASLSLDETYHSGVLGFPGARFVIDLHRPPLLGGGTDVSSTDDEDYTVRTEPLFEPSPLPTCYNPSATRPTLTLSESGSTESLSPSTTSHSTRKRYPNSSSFEGLSTPSLDIEEGPCICGDGTVVVRKEEVPAPAVEKTRTLPSSLKVLFVDDDSTLRKLFARSVRRVAPEWTLEDAPNGETALELVAAGASGKKKEAAYDLIFMDMYMASNQKQLLGTETVELMRERGVSSIICGLSANDEEAKFMQSGADAFIPSRFHARRKR